MGGYSKFSTAEMVIGGMFTLSVDIVSALLDIIPAIGWFIATLLQATISFSTTLWLMFKGGKKAMGLERQLIKQFSNVLPFIPTTFAAFIIETRLHNNPKLAQKMVRSAVKPAK